MYHRKTNRVYCTMTDAELAPIIQRQYTDFCVYRSQIASLMPDYRLGTYTKRTFDGKFFEVRS